MDITTRPFHSLKTTTLGALLGAFVLLFITGSCSTDKKKNNDNAIALPVYTVDTATVKIKKSFLGSVEGKVNVEIRAQLKGQLEAAYVDEGDYVEKGQKLFLVNPQTYRHNLNRAIANKNVKLAELAKAKLEVKRLKPLVEHEVMAPVTLETARSNYKIAQAGLKQAQAEVANAEIKLSYTTIEAPVSGYIGRIPKRVGNLVSAGDVEPITYLTDVHEVYVYFSISESNFYELLREHPEKAKLQEQSVNRIDTNRVVSLILSDGTRYPYKGVINASSGHIDKSTGSILLRASFPNKDNMLRSGNTGTIVLTKTRDSVIVIPQKATFSLQAKTFVKKLDKNNRVIRQLIQVDHEAPNNRYIISSGLNIGDRILVEGMSKVKDSTKIKPMPYVHDTLIAPKIFSTGKDSSSAE